MRAILVDRHALYTSARVLNPPRWVSRAQLITHQGRDPQPPNATQDKPDIQPMDVQE
ncbi:hypothetical protein [Verminephrobacter aporrectodeae]|uniref:hypothetical protein n=1 Tax=Verminephrobacter aporrectodeae TaxID=1110389 RepID=UPI002244D453|nr:hypothetical protein [Verminephrobacter aporrectodeae]